MGSRGGRVTSRGRRRTRQGCGGGRSQPGGSSAGGRSGRQARPGSGGAAALTSLGAEVPPLESPPWLVRAGGRPRPRLRPAAAGLLAGPQEPRGRRSTPGGARRRAPPVQAGTMEPKLVPRRRGGGRAPVRRPGSPDPVAPLSRPGGGSSRFLQPGLHRPAGAPAPRRSREQSWYRAPCGAPLRQEKSPRSPPLFQLRRALAAGEGEVAAMR